MFNNSKHKERKQSYLESADTASATFWVNKAIMSSTSASPSPLGIVLIGVSLSDAPTSAPFFLPPAISPDGPVEYQDGREGRAGGGVVAYRLPSPGKTRLDPVETSSNRDATQIGT